jgi:hypothetical protein
MSKQSASRDAKLDALLKATDDYVKDEQKRIEREVAVLEQVLKGRGWGNLNMPVINTVKAVAEDDLAKYLFGE